MTDNADRPAHYRRRLAYLSHPDAAVGRTLSDGFLEHSFHFSMAADVATIASLISLRRPDLVLMPLGDTKRRVEETLGVLDVIHGLHLGIVVFLLAADGARAELIATVVKRGASEVFSPPYSTSDIVAAASNALRPNVMHGYEQTPKTLAADINTLTYRERQVLRLIIAGRTNEEIATELGLSRSFRGCLAMARERCWRSFQFSPSSHSSSSFRRASKPFLRGPTTSSRYSAPAASTDCVAWRFPPQFRTGPSLCASPPPARSLRPW